MAHLRRIVFQCDKPGCKAIALEQIYTWRNDPQGRYCRVHAKTALKVAEAGEKAYFQQCSDAGMRP